MTTITCDRCGAEIEEDKERQVSINAPGGSMDIILEDACVECVKAVRQFVQPLPKAAP